MAFLMNPLEFIQNQLSITLQKALGKTGIVSNSVIQFQYIEPPRHPGISTTICFDVASLLLKDELDSLEAVHGKKKAKKLLKDKLAEIALSVAQKICTSLADIELTQLFIEKVEAERGYLNFYFDVTAITKSLLNAILTCSSISERGFSFGYGMGEAKETKVMVEYSQPNTHKNFHVGHTRNVALGIAVSNILEFSGYKTIRANYIGDIGAHVLKCLWALEKFPEEFSEIEDGGKRLGEFYALSDKLENSGAVEINNRIVEISKAKFKDDIRAMFARWDTGEPSLLEMWKETRHASLESFDRIYRILGAKFDHVFYESDVENEGRECVEELLIKGIAEIGENGEYEGAVFVDFNRHLPDNDLRQMVIQRKDGSSLYQTKELALARKKFRDFYIDRSIYIVASEQSFYFKQIFALLKLWGLPQADNCVHLPYEIVTLPEGKMSSRSGTVVLFDDLLNEALVRLREITREKGHALDVEDTATKIAVGAIKFSMLNIDHNKVLVFDWDKALNFSGQASPYIQYMAVRAKRILRESKQFSDIQSTISSLLNYLHSNVTQLNTYVVNDYEQRLIISLGRFPEYVEQASERLAPYIITRYAYDISQIFGEFYRFCPVLKCDEPNRTFRMCFVIAFSCVIESCLELLGIEVPQAM